MTVTGGSALGKDEIDKMVKDAEANEEADRKRRESVDMRNEADALSFRTEKILEESGDKIPDDVKTPVTEALAALKGALKGTDDEVRPAMGDHNKKRAAMGQAVYQAAQAEQAAQASAGAEGSAENSGANDDDVVDAEIVDDEKKD